MALVFALVGVMAFGMAMIAPNLSALISKRTNALNTGAALGVQSVANNLGQVGGPILGGALFAWSIGMPFFLTGLLLLATGLVIVWNSVSSAVPDALRGPARENKENPL